MNPHLQRAMMLLEQSRYEMAADELRQALATAPDNPMAHAVLAVCLSHLDQHKRAVEEAEMSIHLAPDQAFPFYAHSIALANRNQFAKAKEAISTAIGLNPYETEHFAQLAQIELSQSHWQAALKAAEQGLELDPEDVTCTNLRAVALTRPGQAERSQGLPRHGAEARPRERLFARKCGLVVAGAAATGTGNGALSRSAATGT